MTFFLRILAVLVLLLMGAVAWMELGSSHWPSVIGTVERGNTANRDKIFFGTSSKVSYSYEVDRKTYLGGQIGFGTISSVIPVVGAKESRQPREGDEVRVYYAPYYHGFAVLVPGARSTLHWWAAISVLVAVTLWAVSSVIRDPVF